nr:MFS transporter [Pseudonocardia sp. AL041005-10]
MSAVHAPPGNRRQSSKVAFASLIGTTVEWYDFYIYGTAAALVFPKLFFPEFSPGAGLLASLSTYAVGFAARPLGGIVFGHYGDRVGRKKMLVLSLLAMGLGTLAMGLVPASPRSASWPRSSSWRSDSCRASPSAANGAVRC